MPRPLVEAMIETPGVPVEAAPRGREDLGDLPGDLRRPGSRRSDRACGKPKKSWMVCGRSMAVTAVRPTYQWAETTRAARGRGTA